MLRSKTVNARLEARVARNASIRLFGMDGSGRPFHIPASTLDISRRGARVEGIRCWESPGETVGVRFEGEKARFRVVWVGAPGTPLEQQVGLYCLEPGKFIWDLLPPGERRSPADEVSLHMKTGLVSLSDPKETVNRRSEPRFRASGRAQVRQFGAAAWCWSMLCDISLNGCYLEIPAPMKEGAELEANLNVAGMQLHVRGTVKGCHPFVGMAVRFTEMSPLNRQRLEQIVSTLARTQPGFKR